MMITGSGCRTSGQEDTTDITLNPTIADTQIYTNTSTLFLSTTSTVALPPQSTEAISELTLNKDMVSAFVVNEWNRFSDNRYRFSFLYPMDYNIRIIDPHHLELLHGETVLDVRFRFVNEDIKLAPVANMDNLIEGNSIPFMGAYTTICYSIQEQPSDSSQTDWEEIYYDCGNELTRGELVFTLRLQKLNQNQTLNGLTPDELHLFNYIVGSFQPEVQKITHPVGSNLNLTQLGLEQTEVIEIGLFNPQIGTTRYLYQHLINDPELVSRLVELLNQKVQVEPEQECIEAYELTFHLTSGQKWIFGYLCSSQTNGLLRGRTSDGTVELGGSVPIPPDFTQILLPEIQKAEQLRDNNLPPQWKSRVLEQTQHVGPFKLQEYTILDPGRWEPYSLEFRVIIPDEVFTKNASLRSIEDNSGTIAPINVAGDTIEVSEIWNEETLDNFAVVKKDGQEIYRIPIRPPAGSSAIRLLQAWNDRWVLEVEGSIIIDGENLNDRLGAKETFDWQIMDSKPFAFFFREGILNAWYDGKIYPLGFDQIVHNTCCEAGMFDVGHNSQMVWFYAHKDGLWRYVEMILD